jgi:flagellar hook-basal body complex protein FliE
MVHFDPNVRSILPNLPGGPAAPGWEKLTPEGGGATQSAAKPGFLNAVETAGKYVSKVNDLQKASDASIQDLLTGKNNDITAVVSAVAKADVSFKVLVGVRNKLIEAYKQTMNMPL